MEHFDLCVIGAGPSGYAAAIRALDYGKKVILIEKDKVGGAGIHHGALSSKTLWELARDARKLQMHDRGFSVHDYKVDYPSVVRAMREAVMQRQDQLVYQLDAMQNEIYSGMFRYAHGFARFVDSHQIEIANEKTDSKEVIYAEHVILATGSRPRKLPHIPSDEKIIVTSDGVDAFEDFPQSIVILGAGVIGCEFATIFANFGQTKVYIIDKADRILPFEDEDVSEVIAKNLENSGVTIHHGSSLESMEIEDGQVKYVLSYEDGRKETHYVEKALISVGRIPNVEGLGLAEIGVNVTDRNNVVDDDTQTSVSHIYAVGDLTADICLVNVGEVEGRHAVERIYANSQKSMSYQNVSTIMFLQPEVAGVGMNEQEAQRRGIPYKVASYNYEYINRAIAMRNSNGFFKVLVTDDDEMKVLGMRAVGEHASSAIQGVSLLIKLNVGVETLAELVHPHPSIVEGVQECVRMLLGTSVMKPRVFTDKLRCNRVANGVMMDI